MYPSDREVPMSDVAMSRLGARRHLRQRRATRSASAVAAAPARHAATRTGAVSLRQACAVAGIIAPIVLLAGVASSVHEIAWYVYYGWGAGVPSEAVASAPAWLAWGVVAGLALLGWRRAAAAAAWLATAGMAVSVATFALIPTPYMGAWFALAALATLALTFSPPTPRGVSVIGKRPLLLLIIAVGAVIFTGLLGHHFTLLYLLAWIGLGAVVLRAARPRTSGGRRAILLLASPAVCAVGIEIEWHALSLDPSLFGGSGPGLATVLPQLYVAPVVVLCLSWLVLRRWERSRAATQPD